MNTIDEIFIIDFSIQLSLTKLTKIYKLSYKKKKRKNEGLIYDEITNRASDRNVFNWR